MDKKRVKGNLRKVVAWGETLACEYLKRQCFEFLERNVSSEFGEKDIVACRSDQVHMIDSEEAYLQTCPGLGTDYQIDVIAIRIGPGGKSSEIIYFEYAL